jgi:hypothetical protein
MQKRRMLKVRDTGPTLWLQRGHGRDRPSTLPQKSLQCCLLNRKRKFKPLKQFR